MKTGFLIVNYNDFETTNILLNTIQLYQNIDQIVVVDNCSSDNSYSELLKVANEHIVILQNSANKGYGSGINLGAKYLIDTLGDCNIIVSNADIVIENEQVLQILIDSKPNDFGIIAPLIKEHEGYSKGWKIPTPMQDTLLNLVYIHKFLRPKLIEYKAKHYTKDSVVDVEVVSGCFFMIDSKALQQVNYFDEEVFLYYEENIISNKLKSIGKKIYINTSIEVFHNHSVSIDKSINHLGKYKELKKSQLYFQKKYNKANICSIGLLKLSEKLSYVIIKLLKK